MSKQTKQSRKCTNHDCNAWATPDGKCFVHSPNMRERAALARKKGGAVKKDPADRITVALDKIELQKMDDVVLLLSETINLVRQGKLDLKVANCLGNLSNFMIRALDAGDIERRIELVERVIIESNTALSPYDQ